MDIMDVNAEVLEKIFNHKEVPVIVLTEFEIDTYVKDNEVYKDILSSEISENVDTKIEPNNPVDKYAACIRISGKVVRHLKKVVTSRFAKTISFLLKGDPYSKTKTINI